MTSQIIHPHHRRSNNTKLASGLIMLLTLLIVIVISNTPFFPRHVAPVSASPAAFSAERALTHLPTIAKVAHPSGSPAQAEVREYIIQQLSALGLEPEIQKSGKIENIVVRLPGSASTGAIVVLAHYDSVSIGPGAADNGSAVSALLEIVRALSSDSPLQNDVIALFDDAEEGPPPFQGTRLFAREHPWMANVKVAIGMDTAAKGFITVNDTGPRNGLVVDALARVHRGYYWSSVTGAGTYDTYPLRQMGKQIIELEDNYCFRQQHTALDQIDMVKPATLQQLGDQALSLTRELGNRDISSPWGTDQVFFSLPVIGFVHYPQALSLPLAIGAVLIILVCIVLALRQKISRGRGLLLGLLMYIVTAAVTLFVVGAIWDQIPHLLSWKTQTWPEWPEVIPPNGEILLAIFILLTLNFCIAAFRLSRTWAWLTDLSFIGLLVFAVFAVVLAIGSPRSACLPLMPSLVSGLAWLISLIWVKDSQWKVIIPSFITALVFLAFLVPLPLLQFFSNGFNNIALVAAIWSIFFLVVFPAIEAIVNQMRSA